MVATQLAQYMPVTGRVNCLVDISYRFCRGGSETRPYLHTYYAATGYSISARKSLISSSEAGASKAISTFLVARSAFTDCTPCSSATSVWMVWMQCAQEILGTV